MRQRIAEVAGRALSRRPRPCRRSAPTRCGCPLALSLTLKRRLARLRRREGELSDARPGRRREAHRRGRCAHGSPGSARARRSRSSARTVRSLSRARPARQPEVGQDGDVTEDRATRPRQVGQAEAGDLARCVGVPAAVRAQGGGVGAPLHHAEGHVGPREGVDCAHDRAARPGPDERVDEAMPGGLADLPGDRSAPAGPPATARTLPRTGGRRGRAPGGPRAAVPPASAIQQLAPPSLARAQNDVSAT